MADSDGYLGMYENPKDGVGEEDVDDYDGVDALEPDRESLDLDGDEVLDTTPPTGGSSSTRHRQLLGMISPLDQGRAIGRGTRGRGRLVPLAAPSGGRGRGRGAAFLDKSVGASTIGAGSCTASQRTRTHSVRSCRGT